MNIYSFEQFLGLTKPVEIVLKSREKKITAAYWQMVSEGKLQYHLIHVYMGNLKNANERSLETLIAHELIHAWQAERGHKDIHGPSFKAMAASMSFHYSLPEIYIPGRDI